MENMWGGRRLKSGEGNDENIDSQHRNSEKNGKRVQNTWLGDDWRKLVFLNLFLLKKFTLKQMGIYMENKWEKKCLFYMENKWEKKCLQDQKLQWQHPWARAKTGEVCNSKGDFEGLPGCSTNRDSEKGVFHIFWQVCVCAVWKHSASGISFRYLHCASFTSGTACPIEVAFSEARKKSSVVSVQRSIGKKTNSSPVELQLCSENKAPIGISWQLLKNYCSYQRQLLVLLKKITRASVQISLMSGLFLSRLSISATHPGSELSHMQLWHRATEENSSNTLWYHTGKI